MLAILNTLASGEGSFTDYFVWWQIPLVILLVIVIVFYVMYRRRQM